MAEPTSLRLEDWLDDLCVRFIINLPREELESVERICFQVEEAQWFYEDFIRPLDPNLPSMSLRQFAFRIFQHCPLMSEWSHHHHTAAFSEFLAYKTRVPVRGAILLDQEMEHVVLVKGWKKGANWSFPRGKINKGEKDLDCAIREVYEETGFDIKAAGLAEEEEKAKYIEIPMREQNMRLYVVRGVPRDTHFEPRTRKEISKIDWYTLSELPTLKQNKQIPAAAGPGGQSMNGNGSANKFYMVAPFLGPLKKWIAQQRKLDQTKASSAVALTTEGERPRPAPELEHDSPLTQKSRERAQPSDLPEVSASQDPTAEMKRLLNIGTAPSIPQIQHPQPHVVPDPSKGNVLLNLLRQGSEHPSAPSPNSGQPAPVSFHPEKGTSQPLPQAFNWQPGFAGPPAFPHPGPAVRSPPVAVHHGRVYAGNLPHPSLVGIGFHHTYHPGTEHTYYGAPHASNRMPNRMHPMHQQPYYPSPISPMRAPPNHFQNMMPSPPPHLPAHNVSVPQRAPQPPPTSVSSAQTRQIPAPYQRTGDPQFAQATRFSGAADAPSVPPASKLPLPKLTNHSLALLNAFKGDGKKTEPPAPEPPTQQVAHRPSERGRKSEHHLSLLSLLKQEPSVASATAARGLPTTHAELSSLPSPQIPGYKLDTIKILKKDSAVQGPPPKPFSTTRTTGGIECESEATLSGPLNLPNFEAAKSSRKQHIPQAASKEPREPKEAKEQKKAKPPNITILPRPSQPKESPSPTPIPETRRSPPKRNIKLADLAKPFSPKVLRRPDKGNLDAYLPTHTVEVSAFSRPDEESTAEEQKEEPRQLNYDRRPSQPTSQKQALLSLFGKRSPSAAGFAGSREEFRQSVSPPPVASPLRSTVISPLVSSASPVPRTQPLAQPPTSATKPSSPIISPPAAVPPPAAAPTMTKDRARLTSPVDKAFLLGFLEGVAKGNR